MKSFKISVLHDKHLYTYTVKQISVTKREEIYELISINEPIPFSNIKTALFTNNRPFLKYKNLKHWKVKWKIDGEIWNVYFKNLIILAMIYNFTQKDLVI